MEIVCIWVFARFSEECWNLMKETIKIILNKESSIFWTMQSSPLVTRSGVDSFRKGKKRVERTSVKTMMRKRNFFLGCLFYGHLWWVCVSKAGFVFFWNFILKNSITNILWSKGLPQFKQGALHPICKCAFFQNRCNIFSSVH